MIKKIALVDEHLIQMTCDSTNLWELIEPNFQFVNSSAFGAINVTLDILGNYGSPFSDFHVAISDAAGGTLYRRTDYLLEIDRDFKKAVIRAYDKTALKHALLNFYSSYLLHLNWGILIHSSCVIDGGQAHLFAGESGVGKSTAARLSKPRQLLSDEATLIKITPAGITVFNSPFRSDIPANNIEDSCPLSSIQLLHQSSENKRIQIKKSSALLQLYKLAFYWTNKPEDMPKILLLFKTMIDQVPVYDLYFQKNNSFWQLISQPDYHQEAVEARA
ncbi:hypothetical protein [Sporolactobacillus pectinivorans]|uniref:hypothetical protein n=1 Tax=Sporolactobacillus pectinivorans TaxID=1591408 RepID=UPI000C2609B5|nr:hypothetical protein [Sporolactobacillus pectinivorans]